jgi:hypothetical protein
MELHHTMLGPIEGVSLEKEKNGQVFNIAHLQNQVAMA